MTSPDVDDWVQGLLAGKPLLPVPRGGGEAAFTAVLAMRATGEGSPDRAMRGLRKVLEENISEDQSFLHRALAVVHLLKDEPREAALSFHRAAQAHPDPRRGAAFAVGAIDAWARAGEPSLAREAAERLLASQPDPGDEGRIRLNYGNALLWTDDWSSAREQLQKACHLLSQTGQRESAAAALLGLSTASLFAGSPSESRRWSLQAEEELRSLGMPALADHASVNAAHADMVQGRHDQAILRLDRLRLAAKEGSLEKLRLTQFLAEAHREAGLAEEAEALARAALRSSRIRQAPDNRAALLVLLAECSLLKGQRAGARRLLRKAREHSGPATTLRVACLMAYAGNPSLLASAIAEAEARGADHSLAELCLAAAEWSQDLADLPRAEALIEEHDLLHLAWRPLWLRLQVSPTDDLARRLLEAIIRHREVLSTLAVRTSILGRSLPAIRDCLGQLLSEPSPERTREAAEAIRALRSSVLADEILLGSPSLPPEVLADLQALRDQAIQWETGSGDGSQLRSPGRRSVALLPQAARMRAALGLVPAPLAPRTKLPVEGIPILAFLSRSLAWIEGERAEVLPFSPESLAGLLHDLEFQLIAPLQGFKWSRSGEALLNQLRSRVLPSFPLSRLSPEGCAFQIPWSLLLPEEAVVHLRPGLPCPDEALPPNPRVGILASPDASRSLTLGEVDDLRNLFPSARVAASRAELLDMAAEGPLDLLHVACHGEHCPENPMFSAFWLSDGPLLACEVARMGLRVNHAVLASCDSGGLGSPSGWEPQGWARAFRACGARHTLASLWPWEDRAAHLFLREYYNGLAEGLSIRAAMAAARTETRRARPEPVYWGAPFLIGSED